MKRLTFTLLLAGTLGVMTLPTVACSSATSELGTAEGAVFGNEAGAVPSETVVRLGDLTVAMSVDGAKFGAVATNGAISKSAPLVCTLRAEETVRVETQAGTATTPGKRELDRSERSLVICEPPEKPASVNDAFSILISANGDGRFAISCHHINALRKNALYSQIFSVLKDDKGVSVQIVKGARPSADPIALTEYFQSVFRPAVDEWRFNGIDTFDDTPDEARVMTYLVDLKEPGVLNLHVSNHDGSDDFDETERNVTLEYLDRSGELLSTGALAELAKKTLMTAAPSPR